MQICKSRPPLSEKRKSLETTPSYTKWKMNNNKGARGESEWRNRRVRMRSALEDRTGQDRTGRCRSSGANGYTASRLPAIEYSRRLALERAECDDGITHAPPPSADMCCREPTGPSNAYWLRLSLFLSFQPHRHSFLFRYFISPIDFTQFQDSCFSLNLSTQSTQM